MANSWQFPINRPLLVSKKDYLLHDDLPSGAGEGLVQPPVPGKEDRTEHTAPNQHVVAHTP